MNVRDEMPRRLHLCVCRFITVTASDMHVMQSREKNSSYMWENYYYAFLSGGLFKAILIKRIYSWVCEREKWEEINWAESEGEQGEAGHDSPE